MKLSAKQVELLAKEVLKSIKAQGVAAVSPLTVAKLKQFKEEREKLMEACKQADDKLDAHDKTLKKIVNSNGIYARQGVSEMVETLKKESMPTEREIQDKIILNAMFTDETELELFVQKISKEFLKKKKLSPTN